MDRVISLVAALVGLIAPGGAILVHTNADVQRHEMATEIAQLAAPPSSSEPAAAMATADPAAAASPAPASGSTPAAFVANGPTKDCTRSARASWQAPATAFRSARPGWW